METLYEIFLTKRQAETYSTIVDLALRGDLPGVQRLVRSQAGVALCAALRAVGESPTPTALDGAS